MPNAALEPVAAERRTTNHSLHAEGKKAAQKPAAPGTRAPGSQTQPRAKSELKLVRSQFTMPQADFDLIAELKLRAANFGRPAKKNELLRAGLHALTALNDATLRGGLDTLLPAKPGRKRK